nr:reverse transcriptase domain-containing protein [Tanacetum cinerariifolium]
MTTNRIDVIDMACEEYSQEVLAFSDVIASGNPTPYYDPIVSTTSLTLTPFRNSNFLLEEVDAFLALEDDPTSPKVDQNLSALSSIDKSLEVELKDLSPHLEYAFLEGDDKLPVIITKDLSKEEKTALITVLKSHKRAIALKLSDIKGINPEFCTHKILIEEDFEPAKTIKSFVDEPPEVELKDLPPYLEYAFLEGDNKFPVIITKELGDKEKAALIKVLKSHKRAIAWKLSDIQGDYKLAVQHQRQVNPKIHDVIKKEVEKLLDAGLIYPISDSPWVSSVHCVPKKGGFT